jgi:hypothetical protein
MNFALRLACASVVLSCSTAGFAQTVEPSQPAPVPTPAPSDPVQPAPTAKPVAPSVNLLLLNARAFEDRVEIGLRVEGTGSLEVSIADRNCPASLSPGKLEAAGYVTLSVIPKGYAPCTVAINVSDGTNSSTFRLKLENPGESGFNVLLQGGGSFNAANGFGADGAITISGGIGDLHLEGYAYTSLDVFVDGRFKLRYFGSSLELADSQGTPGLTAGNAGRGIYAQQDIGITDSLGLSVGLGVPFGLPARAGIGFVTPNFCGNSSFNFRGTDAIFFAQGGYGGLYARAQYRPKATTFLDYTIEYSSAPEFHITFGGSEKNAYLEANGFISEAALLYRLRADKDFTGPSWSTSGNLTVPFANFGWKYTPGAAQIDADTFFGGGDPWDFTLGASMGKTIGVAARAGVRYRENFDGALTVGFDLSAQTVAFPDSVKANFKIIYASQSGWQFNLETQTPITHPEQTNFKLGLSTLFYIPLSPLTPNLQLEVMPSATEPATPASSNPAVQPGVCR